VGRVPFSNERSIAMRVAATTAICLAVFAVSVMGGAASAQQPPLEVEPDFYPEGTVLNTDAYPGVTLSNKDGPAPTIISVDGSSIVAGTNIATTPTLVFGRVQPPPRSSMETNSGMKVMLSGSPQQHLEHYALILIRARLRIL
jgi:hypothetical protein